MISEKGRQGPSRPQRSPTAVPIHTGVNLGSDPRQCISRAKAKSSTDTRTPLERWQRKGASTTRNAVSSRRLVCDHHCGPGGRHAKARTENELEAGHTKRPLVQHPPRLSAKRFSREPGRSLVEGSGKELAPVMVVGQAVVVVVVSALTGCVVLRFREQTLNANIHDKFNVSTTTQVLERFWTMYTSVC